MRRHRAYCAVLAASTGFRGICTMHAMPQVPSGMQLHLPRVSYARFPNIQRAAICIHPRHAHTGHAYSASACSRRIPHLRGAMRITLSDHQKHRRQCRSANGLWHWSEHQNRVCSFARSNCRLLVCVPRFRATRGTKLFAHTPDGIPPWNAIRRQGAAFRSRLRSYAIVLAMARDSPHAGRQRRIGIHAGRWQAPARIWHRDRLLRCRIRDFLLRGALHVRHIPARTSWRIRHRPGNQRRESLT